MLFLVRSLSLVSFGNYIVALLTSTATVEYDAGPEYDVRLILASEAMEIVLDTDSEYAYDSAFAVAGF